MSHPMIAVIADDALFVDTLAALLMAAGYQVLIALTAMHGYLLIWRQQPKLVILDTQMDASWRILEVMRRHTVTQHIPVLLCLDNTQSLEQQQEQLLTDQTHILEKPFTREVFLVQVAAVLGTASQAAGG